MKYSFIPGTSVSISQVTLGTMMFGGQTSEADSLSILDYAIESGINSLDVADFYNQGETERIVGKSLKTKNREDIILATKACQPMGSGLNNWGLNRRYLLTAFDACRKRLDTDYIDLFYIHGTDFETKPEETLETLSNLVVSGKIFYYGVCNHAAWQVADMLAICDKYGFVPPVMTQNIYNNLHRDLEEEMIPFVLHHKMGLAVYNPLAGGFLTGKHKPGAPAENTRFSNAKNYYERYWNDANFSAIQRLSDAAAKEGMSLIELALRWLSSRAGVTTMVCGVSKLEQLKQNVAALDGPAPGEETLKICDEVWQALPSTIYKYNWKNNARP